MALPNSSARPDGDDPAPLDRDHAIAERRAAVAVDQEAGPEVPAAVRWAWMLAGGGAIILRHRI